MYSSILFARSSPIPAIFRSDPAESDRFDVVGQTFEIRSRSAIGAHAKRIRSLDFEQVGDLIEDESDLEISHDRFLFYFFLTSFKDSANARLSSGFGFAVDHFFRTRANSLSRLAREVARGHTRTRWV